MYVYGLVLVCNLPQFAQFICFDFDSSTREAGARPRPAVFCQIVHIFHPILFHLISFHCNSFQFQRALPHSRRRHRRHRRSSISIFIVSVSASFSFSFSLRPKCGFAHPKIWPTIRIRSRILYRPCTDRERNHERVSIESNLIWFGQQSAGWLRNSGG